MVSVYFFVPNLIGYARVVMALWSFIIAYDKPELFLVLYTTSFVQVLALHLCRPQSLFHRKMPQGPLRRVHPDVVN